VSATARLHALAGSPRIADCDDLPARCVVCAAHAERTHEYDSWAGSQFTDQNKMRGHGLSTRVCEPCVWAHSWVAPPDQEPNPPGKKGLNLRLFSHLWSESDGYRSLNKGDKPAIRAWLRDRRDGERWWCCIADTGQKHARTPFVIKGRSREGAITWREEPTGDAIKHGLDTLARKLRVSTDGIAVRLVQAWSEPARVRFVAKPGFAAGWTGAADIIVSAPARWLLECAARGLGLGGRAAYGCGRVEAITVGART
jgi:hypothetical protein